MRFGVHLPLIGFRDDDPVTLDRLVAVAEAASQLGYSSLAANDHLVFRRPWLDGPTALAAVLAASGDLDLFTTVGLPGVRGPVPFAKAVAALDLLSGGRLVVGVGPGSSANDYRAVGLEFDERWSRLDEAAAALRSLLAPDGPEFAGRFYTTGGLGLRPLGPRPEGPPIWIGSWGSDAGLRRVARLADGWLASSYNTNPELFADARERLDRYLADWERERADFPNGLATMMLYLVDDESEARRVLSDQVGPALGRTPDELAPRLLVCSPEEARDRLRAYQAAGVQTMFVWPVADEVTQLARFAKVAAPFSEG
jgi:alkanesulfonate monooxygenase SsuD/methylene tetrahydromethanopterin reductase-like flavin-dependent oxidoreductase (luciferase family)